MGAKHSTDQNIINAEDFEEVHMEPNDGTEEEFTVVRDRRTGQLYDRYRIYFPTEQDYQYYMDSFKFRRNESNIVRAYFYEPKHKKQFCSTTYGADVYLEHCRARLSDYKDIPYPDNLYCMMAMLDGYNKLFEKVGRFFVSQRQVLIDENGQIRVWINSDMSRNEPEDYQARGRNQIEQQYDMVDDVVDMVNENTDDNEGPKLKFSDYYEREKVNYHNKVGFQNAKAIVHDYARYNGTTIPNVFESVLEIYKSENFGGRHLEDDIDYDADEDRNPVAQGPDEIRDRDLGMGMGFASTVHPMSGFEDHRIVPPTSQSARNELSVRQPSQAGLANAPPTYPHIQSQQNQNVFRPMNAGFVSNPPVMQQVRPIQMIPLNGPPPQRIMNIGGPMKVNSVFNPHLAPYPMPQPQPQHFLQPPSQQQPMYKPINLSPSYSGASHPYFAPQPQAPHPYPQSQGMVRISSSPQNQPIAYNIHRTVAQTYSQQQQQTPPILVKNLNVHSQIPNSNIQSQNQHHIQSSQLQSQQQPQPIQKSPSPASPSKNSQINDRPQSQSLTLPKISQHRPHVILDSKQLQIQKNLILKSSQSKSRNNGQDEVNEEAVIKELNQLHRQQRQRQEENHHEELSRNSRDKNQNDLGNRSREHQGHYDINIDENLEHLGNIARIEVDDDDFLDEEQKEASEEEEEEEDEEMNKNNEIKQIKLYQNHSNEMVYGHRPETIKYKGQSEYKDINTTKIVNNWSESNMRSNGNAFTGPLPGNIQNKSFSQSQWEHKELYYTVSSQVELDPEIAADLAHFIKT